MNGSLEDMRGSYVDSKRIINERGNEMIRGENRQMKRKLCGKRK